MTLRTWLSRFQTFLKSSRLDPVRLPARATWDIGPRGASLIAKQKAAAARLGENSIKPIGPNPGTQEET